MATVTISIKRQNGVNLTATSTDIDDSQVIEIAMMLGALVFDSASNPLTAETIEPPEQEPQSLPVPVPQEVLNMQP